MLNKKIMQTILIWNIWSLTYMGSQSSPGIRPHFLNPFAFHSPSLISPNLLPLHSQLVTKLPTSLTMLALGGSFLPGDATHWAWDPYLHPSATSHMLSMLLAKARPSLHSRNPPFSHLWMLREQCSHLLLHWHFPLCWIISINRETLLNFPI